jgi:agmatine/peptidylarginine deiminase
MINDYETNTVYLAKGINHYRPMASNLLTILSDKGIDVQFLPLTESYKHVWARDYMPIQVDDNRFLQYRYNPDYLKNDQDYIPPYESIIQELNLNCNKTGIIIDGGNVVKCGQRVIMTDKVIKENPMYSPRYLISLLEKAFECEVCLIPRDCYEMYGHADGMVRSIGFNYVLMNNYVDFDRPLRDKLKNCLQDASFYVEELHYDIPRPSKLSWAYLNFLQLDGHIFVPALGLREDDIAIDQIRKYYSSDDVVPVPGCLPLVRDGGALNCITWTLYKSSH